MVPETWFWITLALIGWTLLAIIASIKSSELKHLVTKTSIANIVAGIVVVGVLIYALVYQREPPEMIKTLAYMTAVYLFGKGIAHASSK